MNLLMISCMFMTFLTVSICCDPNLFPNCNFFREQHVLLESLEIMSQITLGGILSQVQCHVHLSLLLLLALTQLRLSSVQFSSVAQSCPTLCDPMNCSTPGLPVHHQLPEFTQTHVHRVSDAIQPSHPLSSPPSPVPNPSQHQSLFQWVNSSHEVA